MSSRPRPPEGSERRPGEDSTILRSGSELGGLELRRLISGDDFCSLWMTAPLDEGFTESCMKVIPEENLHLPGAFERLRCELSFWEGASSPHVVDLYEVGREAGYCFLVMRYIDPGSAAEQLRSDDWLKEHAERFALDLATALREVHAASGAHGNLKPSNVFPVRTKDVLLSDFAVPLLLEEYQQGCPELATRLLHPYRAPEQVASIRDFDTRSDIYSYALIVLQCLTGAEPDPEAGPPELSKVKWPGRLGAVMERCLRPEPGQRPADGFELVELVGEALGMVTRRPASPSETRGPGRPSDSSVLDSEEDVERLMENARFLVQEGRLEEAVEIMETLPADTAGIEDLVDEIEARQRACGMLTREAVALAGIGQSEAAAETIARAEELWPHSKTLIAVKSELAAEAGQQFEEESGERGGVPAPLGAALEGGRFDAARAMLEKVVRQGPLTDQQLAALDRFKHERVRRAVLDNAAAARRLYVLGHHDQAQEHWLEVARWLPPGPERERVRRIAGAAAKGRLIADDHQPAPQAMAATAPERRERRRLSRRALLALAVVVALLVAFVTLLWAVLGG